jgi:hypothetical protein
MVEYEALCRVTELYEDASRFENDSAKRRKTGNEVEWKIVLEARVLQQKVQEGSSSKY